MAVKVKDGRYRGSDRISFLPDEIIEQILVCLTLKEAARTSILSKKWRYIWIKLPELLFDESLFSHRQDMGRRMEIMSEILLRHTGSIRKFTFSLSGQLEVNIDSIVRYVCNNAMKDFKLNIRWEGHYEVKEPIFSCTKLESLYLKDCRFSLSPVFNVYGMLTSLKLYNVIITGDVCSSLISSCPKLERLTLKTLIFCDHLEIVAPNLRLFCCRGFFMDICFKNTPRLEIMSIGIREYWPPRIAAAKDGENLAIAFDGLHALKHAEVTSSFLKYMIRGTVPERFQSDLTYLEAIILHSVSFEEIDEVKRVLCLIRSSPNLEKLKVTTWPNKDAPFPTLEDFKTGLLGLNLNKLREVEMVCAKVKRQELLFIEILLAKAPVLERMVIKLLLVSKEEISNLFREVRQLQYASPRAQVQIQCDR